MERRSHPEELHEAGNLFFPVCFTVSAVNLEKDLGERSLAVQKVLCVVVDLGEKTGEVGVLTAFLFTP